MAKKKKKTHRTHHRRRVSGLGSITHGLGGKLMKLGGMMLGNAVGISAQRRVPLNAKITSAIMGIGGLIVEDHMKNPLTQGLALGFANAGATGLGHEFHLIAGVDDFVNGIDSMDGMYDDRTRLDGVRNDDHMQGIRNDEMLSGTGGGASASM